MTAISRGAPLRIIAARDAHFPVATISLKSLGISTAASYEGKRWATSVGANPELTVMGELARVAGFDQHSIRIVNIPFNARAAALISDQADFASAWYGSGLPIIGSILAKAGIPYTYVRWSDFGIDIYGQCLAARNDWLETHSALAHAFLKATVKGFETAINSPSDAVSATIKQNPNAGLDASIVREQWSQAVELLTDDYSSKHGLLTMDPVKIEKTAIMANLSTNIHFFTNDYLPHY